MNMEDPGTPRRTTDARSTRYNFDAVGEVCICRTCISQAPRSVARPIKCSVLRSTASLPRSAGRESGAALICHNFRTDTHTVLMAHNGSGDSFSSHVEPNIYEIDPSRTARQIYALGDVEKVCTLFSTDSVAEHIYILLQDISRLLSLAASSISLLTLPQTDGPDDNLSQGDERSEQFVLEVSEYFERLDVSTSSYVRKVKYHLQKSVFERRLSKLPFAPLSLIFASRVLRLRRLMLLRLGLYLL